MTATTNALEFANSLTYPVVFFAGNGQPAGMSIAMLGETALPFDLEQLEGEVKGGTFEATNLNDGSGAHGWKFHDFKGNLIYKIQVFEDQKTWEQQHEDWMRGE